MTISKEELTDLHFKLLEQCIVEHGKQFKKDVQQATDVVKKARRNPLAPPPAQHLHNTAKQALSKLGLHKPDLSSPKGPAVEYALSPITRYFIQNKQRVNQAFMLFASPEHQELGNALTLPGIASGELPMLYEQNGQLIENQNLSLTPGDIVFLTGDYYANPHHPIADEMHPNGAVTENTIANFKAAYESLAKGANNKKVDAIKKILHSTYSKNKAINSYIQQIQFVLLNPSSLIELYDNIDHFPPWSQQAYQAGHQLAMQTAQQAYAQDNPELLKLAYMYELSAQHYLSDEEAGSHLRIGLLRTKLRDDFGLIGSALVNDMHNEDGELGVNAMVNGQVVTLKGDGHLDDASNQKGKQLVHQAMQSGINEVYGVYQNGHIPQQSQVDKFIPKPLPTAQQNSAPMFTIKNNNVYYRSPIDELNPDNVQYEPLTTLKAFVILIMRRVFNLKAKYTPTQEKDSGPKPTRSITMS